jgi:hypothetical protein
MHPGASKGSARWLAKRVTYRARSVVPLLYSNPRDKSEAMIGLNLTAPFLTSSCIE